MKSAAKKPLLVTPCDIPMRYGIGRFERQGFLEDAKRHIAVCGRIGEGMRESAEIEIVGVEAIRPLVARPFISARCIEGSMAPTMLTVS